MKTYTIDYETNEIMVHASAQEAEAVANAERFRNEGGLAKLATEWPMARLIEIWNSLPGVERVKKFKDRATAVSRIWKAIQTLGTETGEAPIEETSCADPVAEPVVESAPETVPGSVPETEPATQATATDVAPQGADVAPEPQPARVRATRQNKTPTEPKTATPRAETKTSQVIAMLKREQGASLQEIMTTMGWLKHTTRAMLSAGGSLVKRHALTIASEKVGEIRRYYIKG